MTMTLAEALDAIILCNASDPALIQRGAAAAEIIYAELQKIQRRAKYANSWQHNEDFANDVILKFMMRTTSPSLTHEGKARGYLTTAFNNARKDYFRAQSREKETFIRMPDKDDDTHSASSIARHEGRLSDTPEDNIELQDLLKHSVIFKDKESLNHDLSEYIIGYLQQSLIPTLGRRDTCENAQQSLIEMIAIDKGHDTFESLARKNLGDESTEKHIATERARLHKAHSRARERLESRAESMHLSGMLKDIDLMLIREYIGDLRSRAEASPKRGCCKSP